MTEEFRRASALLVPRERNRQLVDFAHARTSVARRGMRIPSVGPVPPSVVHPDTAGSDVFERFEALSARAKSDAESDARSRRDPSAVGGPRLQVTMQFDARVHDGTQRGAHGPKSYVDQSAPEKKGPLLELFLAYARRDDHRRRDAPLFFSKKDVDEKDEKDVGAGSLLSRAEVFGMMRDFAVVPSLVTERDARLAFAHADAPAVGDAAATNKEDELDFHEFCRFLANAATLLSASSGRPGGVFHGPEAGEQESAAAARRLLRHLECDSRDTRRLRAKVDEAFRLADRNPRAEKEKDARGPRALPGRTGERSGYARADANDDTISLEEARAVVVSMKGVSLDDGFFTKKKATRQKDERGRRRFAAALAVLTRRENPERDAPAWTEFPSPAVDCGTLFPGETRRFRVRVANKSLNGSVAVSVRTEGAPCLEARFRETKILAPGLTETVQLVAGADAAGEWLGAVIVDAAAIGDHKKEDKNDKKETVVVPVYLNVVHRDREIVTRAGEPLGVRGYARADGVAGATEPGREAAFGFAAPPPPRGADAAERLRMRDPTFVSKRNITSSITSSAYDVQEEHRDAFFSETRARADAARAAASRVAANASARDRGWWGENSEERVFHEVANMREMARLEARRRGDATGKTGKTGKTETAETAFRLSARGLRY